MTPEQKVQAMWMLGLMTPFGLAVIGWMLAATLRRGGRVKADRFDAVDVLIVFGLVALFSTSVLMAAVAGSKIPQPKGRASTSEIATATPAPVEPAPMLPGTSPSSAWPEKQKEGGKTEKKVMATKDIIANSLFPLVLVAAVFGVLAYRKQSPIRVFGFDQMPLWKATLCGATVIAALFAPLTLSILATQSLMGGAAKEQDVVTMFRDAALSQDGTKVIVMFIMAVIVAPFAEEVIFRGYLYGVFKKWAGVIPSVVFTATLFSVVHGSLVVAPGLLILALALTLAYEWSGSLLMPIAMHATFNAAQLGVLLAHVSQSATP